MVDIVQRLCGEDWSISDKEGNTCILERGKEYTTTAKVTDGKVIVFTNYWVPAPIDIFFDKGKG